MQYQVNAPQHALTWYFPHRFVYLAARFDDVRAARRRAASGRVEQLRRLETGSRDPFDLQGLNVMVAGVWIVLTVLSSIPMFAVIGVESATNYGVPEWILLLSLALVPGTFSFGIVIYLHGRAFSQGQRGRLDGLGRAFALPRRANLWIIPIFIVLSFLFLLA